MKKICKSVLSLCLTALFVLSFCQNTVCAMGKEYASSQNMNLNSKLLSASNSISDLKTSNGDIVTNWNDLNDALLNPSISTITIGCDIDLEDSLTIDRDMRIISNSQTETYKLYAMPGKRHIVFSKSDETAIHLEFSNIELDCMKNDAGGLKREGNGPVSIDNLILRGFKSFTSGEDTDEFEIHKWGIDIPNLTLNNSAVVDCRSNGVNISSGELSGCVFEQDTSTNYGYYTGVCACAVTISGCQFSNFSDAGIAANGSSATPTEITNTKIFNCRFGVKLSSGTYHYEPLYYANITNCDIRHCASGVYLNAPYDEWGSISNCTTAKIVESRIFNCGEAVNSTGGRIYLEDSHCYDNSY